MSLHTVDGKHIGPNESEASAHVLARAAKVGGTANLAAAVLCVSDLRRGEGSG